MPSISEDGKIKSPKQSPDTKRYNKIKDNLVKTKKKKLKYKQPFIEYINVESYKTFNSIMCFSDPSLPEEISQIKVKRNDLCCKCTKCLIF